MDPIKAIREKAKKDIKTILLPESEDERVLEAGFYAAKNKIARVIFLAHDKENVKSKLRGLGRCNEKAVEVISPKESGLFITLVNKFYEKRKHKNIDKNYCRDLLSGSSVFLAAMMVDGGMADGFVAGASHLTRDVAKAAIQCLGVDKTLGVASGSFLVYVKGSKYGNKGLFLFADCGLVPDPTPAQLAGIAVSTARVYKKLFDDEAYIAMLSYSTHGSGGGPSVDKVKQALAEVKKLDQRLIIDGELQSDSALDVSVAKRKTGSRGSRVAGRANVLIFPNLDSGNIGYKLVQRLAGARAVGPIMQGLKKPCSDLSRGCCMEDVIDAIAITAIQAQE